MIAPQARLSFDLLGGFRVYCSCRGDLEVRQARFQRLLAYLLLNRNAIPTRRAVAFAFWPDTNERQALNNLRTLLHRLRLTFPELDQFLALESEALVWRKQSGLTLDIADFEQALADASQAKRIGDATEEIQALRSAISIYAGELLPNYYDEWVTEPREQLRLAYLNALQRLADLYLERREYEEAEARLRTMLRIDPLHESGHRLLMQVRLAQGDRTGALRTYHAFAGLLRRELGVDPDPTTQALHQQVLRIGASVHADEPPQNGQGSDGPLVGREAEWRALLARWQDAQAGKPTVLFITGEAGMGCTRLAEAFVAYAESRGSETARARCFPTSRDLAYAPIAQWLLDRTLHERLQQAPREVVSRVMPLIDPQATESEAIISGDAAWSQWLLWDALLGLLIRRGRVPPVFLIDDLHFCDAATLRWLAYALRRGVTPFLILATGRSDSLDGNPGLMELRADLQSDGSWRELALGPLSLQATAELAQQITGVQLSADSVGRLYQLTGGHPLFVVETLRENPKMVVELEQPVEKCPCGGCAVCFEKTSLSPRIHALMRQRLEFLSEPAKAIVQAAAIVGRPFAVSLMAHVTKLSDAALHAALDELWQRHVLREQDVEQYDFAHDLLRVAVYSNLSPLRRKTLHYEVAEALEAVAAHATADQTALLAHHWNAAGQPKRAVGYWLAAGEQQRLCHAEDEAARHYQRAATAFLALGEEEQAARTFMKCGLAFQAAFRFHEANKAYDEAFRLWRQSRPPLGPLLARAKRTLRTHWAEPTSLDPTRGADFMSSAIITQLYSGLASQGRAGEVTPDVASGWEVQAKGRRYVVHLRRDTHWNDGSPITAHDFEAAWKRTLDPAVDSGHAQLLYDVRGARRFHEGLADASEVGIVAADEATLIVELETAAPYFPQVLAHPATLPMPRHVATGDAEPTENLSKLVSNGPFMLAEWEHDRSLRLVRNPRYHGRRHGNIQEVLLSLNIPTAEMLRLYDNDLLDVVRLSGDFNMSELQHVQRHYAGEFLSGPRLVTWQLGFDTARPPFDDARVRRALALTCDRERLAHGLLKGLFTPATGGFVPPGIPGHSAGIGLPFDASEGRRLLAEAGFPGGTGFPEVNLLSDNWAGDVVALMAKQWQQRLGITVRTTALPWTDFLTRMTTERVSMYYTAWRADYLDADSFLRGGVNWHKTPWRDARYEMLLEQARTASNSHDRLTHYMAADRLLVESAGIVPIVYGQMHLLIKPRVRHYPFSGIRPWFWTDVIIED